MKPELHVLDCFNSPVLLEVGVTEIVSMIRGRVPALSSHNGHHDIPHCNLLSTSLNHMIFNARDSDGVNECQNIPIIMRSRAGNEPSRSSKFHSPK